MDVVFCLLVVPVLLSGISAMIRLTHDADRLPRPDRAGAPAATAAPSSLFLGTVRDLTGDRVTVGPRLRGVSRHGREEDGRDRGGHAARWPVGDIGLVHRLGHLEVGEVSVAVAVSCPHRAEAFEACRHAIDRLKELVPIWKKENWADGTTEWVHPSEGR